MDPSAPVEGAASQRVESCGRSPVLVELAISEKMEPPLG